MPARIEVVVGSVYGRLTVMREGETKILNNGAKVRTAHCICQCGNAKDINLPHLRNGATKSCGCLHKEFVTKGQITHNDSGSRLHQCWSSMKKRSMLRKSCNVCAQWMEYSNFKEWSLHNGYADDLVLCRNGDVGDYTPDNCRWDTQRSNAVEGLAKYYTMYDPSNKKIIIYNMSRFCINEGLNASCMRDVFSGKQKSHRGWTLNKRKG